MFSIIIPLYNKEEYVEKALDSVRRQSEHDWELLIIDDGSTDNSYEVVQQWLNVYADVASKTQLIMQKNQGVATTRNNAVSLSKGEYIVFLDADDWWASTFLQTIKQLITDFPDAAAYATNYYYVKNRQNRVLSQGVLDGFQRGYFNYCQAYAKNLVMPIWTGAVCVRKKIFEEFSGFKPNLKLGEDFDLWIRIALEYKVALDLSPQSYYNQDVEITKRATRNLHRPEHHMLFNLSYLEPVEQINTDYKNLIDKLRVTGLLPYYLSSEYTLLAQEELKKVDWTRQPKHVRLTYKLPKFMIKSHRSFMCVGSKLKQRLIRLRDKRKK
ncbi:MAG: glycosyltransferase family A protein [Bacteroidales bacterium]|nr:glycosyltransferase family A protein [Bacteroidales bacterium]